MTIMQATAAIVLSLLVPFAVQLIKTEAMTGRGARALALSCSLAAGLVTGFIGGMPSDPGAFVTCVFAVVGGVKAAAPCVGTSVMPSCASASRRSRSDETSNFGRLRSTSACCVCDQPPFASRKPTASSLCSRSSGVTPASGFKSHIDPLLRSGSSVAMNPSP